MPKIRTISGKEVSSEEVELEKQKPTSLGKALKQADEEYTEKEEY